MSILKKTVSVLLAAAVTVSGQSVNSAFAAEEPGLLGRIAEIDEIRQKAVSEFESQEFTDCTTTAKVLCILFSDVTLYIDNVKKHATLERDSDAVKVLDYEFGLFEDAVYEMTHGALKVECTKCWYDEPYDSESKDYITLQDRFLSLPPEYDPDNYDFVFGFTGMYGVFGVTESIGFHNYGYAYVQSPDVAKELELAEAKTPLEEFQKICWTGEVMIHEWMHQIDRKLQSWFDEEGFPICHDYQIEEDDDGTVPDMEITEEDGAVYLTNPKNGFKWKYVEGKYSGRIVDYYEAYLSCGIIDTKHDNRRVGIFPSLWKAIVKGSDLGCYTVQNTETGNYMFTATETVKNKYTDMITFSPAGPLPSNAVWNLRMDETTLQMYDIWIGYDIGDPCFEPGGINLINSQKKNPRILYARNPKAAENSVLLRTTSIGILTATNSAETYSFFVLPAEDGSIQLQPNLEYLKDTLLQETQNGTLAANAGDTNSRWKIETVKTAAENHMIRHQLSGDALTGTTEDALFQPFLYGGATGMQTMLFTRNPQGLYTIQTADQELSLTCGDVIPKAGSTVSFTRTDADSSPQLWNLICTPDGAYQITSAADKSLFLDRDAETGALTLQESTESETQLFEIGMPSEGALFSSPYIRITDEKGNYLGAAQNGVTLSDGCAIWKITELGGGFVKLTACGNQKNNVLTLKQAQNAEGTEIGTDADRFDTDPRLADLTQSWKILRREDGSFRIIPKISYTKGLKAEKDDTAGITLSSKATDFEIREIAFTAEGLSKLRDALLTRISINTLDDSYDLNCDGKINAVDLTLYKRCMLEEM